MPTLDTPHPTGDQGFLKHLNRARILDLVRRQPGLSRAELATQAGLTKMTVGTVVGDLLAQGWLDEGEPRPGGVGRPGRSLSLSAGNFVLLGAEIGVLGQRAVACTLRGEVLASRTLSAPTGPPEQAARQLAGLIAELRRDPAVAGRVILGLGVAVPGPVDPADQTLAYAPNLGWGPVAMLEVLAPHLGELPGLRLIENEANAAAFGEAYRHPQPPEVLAYLSLGTGIGAGLVLAGALPGQPTPQLLHGPQGLAGEIGHTLVQPGGLYCHCGNRGCAETLLSGWALRATLGVAEGESLGDFVAAHLDDAAVQVALRRAGEVLGTLLVNLQRTLNPSHMIIGGLLARLDGPMVETALAFFAAHQQGRPGLGGAARVEVCTDHLLRPARGAAAQVLAQTIGAR
jgi:predicted NBD/HSP70 family sugar kinase